MAARGVPTYFPKITSLKSSGVLRVSIPFCRSKSDLLTLDLYFLLLAVVVELGNAFDVTEFNDKSRSLSSSIS